MKAQERAEFEKLEELRKTIEASPLTQQIKTEKAAEVLAKRQEAAGKLETLRREQAELIPKLREVVRDKEGKYLRVKVDLDAAQDEINSAKVALSREGNSFDADIRLQEKILYETFDPRIDEGIEFFLAKLDWLRSPGRISSRVLNVERNLITDTKTVTGESNADALLEAILYCQNSIKILEGLKLSPEFHIEEIQELKDGIPSIDLYTKPLKREKPLPGSKGINPLHLLPSDSELDWKFGKLMQKFKKVMGG